MSGTVRMPTVLLPNGCDMEKWSVVACDQYTSDRSYWEHIDAFVGDAPSTLRLILPECYLQDDDVPARTAAVMQNMRTYVNSGIFCERETYVQVKRTFASGKVRTGLVAAVDLTQYEYRPGNKARIRATEGTVESRLPPRVKIRAGSVLELPHILLLIDDPKNIVFSAVERVAGETLYDFALNGGGGTICGKSVTDAAAVEAAFTALDADMRARFYQDVLLFVGDGNHSLAAAKQCYENAKRAGDPDAELKRYALCEIVNIYDTGIEFEPIHRAVFGVDPQAFAARLQAASAAYPVSAFVRGGGQTYPVRLPKDPIDAVAFVQSFLEQSGETVDYIHGDDVLQALGERADCVTIHLPPIAKSGFTEYILQHGVLPKKTFSMGHAEEKRYYLEARKIAAK